MSSPPSPSWWLTDGVCHYVHPHFCSAKLCLESQQWISSCSRWSAACLSSHQEALCWRLLAGRRETPFLQMFPPVKEIEHLKTQPNCGSASKEHQEVLLWILDHNNYTATGFSSSAGADTCIFSHSFVHLSHLVLLTQRSITLAAYLIVFCPTWPKQCPAQ